MRSSQSASRVHRPIRKDVSKYTYELCVSVFSSTYKDRYGLIGLIECRAKDVNCNSRAAKHERKYAARHEKFWIRR